jgi:rhodanese-related sulfurtransferase
MTAVDTAVARVDAAELRRQLTDGDEIALVDIREGDAYAAGHISVAVPISDSELELLVPLRVPRRAVRLVVADDDGGTAAELAAVRLNGLGYLDVRVLAGGVQAWARAGNELITGVNSLSKALGEFVERQYRTPRISVTELKQRLDAGENLVVLDTRPLPEYRHIAIPTGRPAPGAELLYRVFGQVTSDETPIVVNCAGRTRAIIGAQALINAGVPNPVLSLENGTSAWLFAGYEPVHGSDELVDAPAPEALKRATDAAARIRRRFGVGVVGAAELATLRGEAEDRTLYLFDIRTSDEYERGHLHGALSAPGGQLVQATDLYIGTRNARVVLIDSPDLVRSSITASWLVQLGLDGVTIYGAQEGELTEHAAPPHALLAQAWAAAVVSPVALSERLREDPSVTLIDLRPAESYYETRRYIGGSVVARRSTLLHDAGLLADALKRGDVVLVSADGYLARLAAAELTQITAQPVYALDGGLIAWHAAGLATVSDDRQQAFVPSDALPPVPDLDTRRATFAQYVAWGDQITEQLQRDGIVQFRAFE